MRAGADFPLFISSLRYSSCSHFFRSKSDLMNTSVKYSIYLPESYDGTKKYPVLYMLHGYGGNNNDWLQDNTGSIWAGGGTMPAYAREYAEKTGKELIIVAPDGGNNFYCG